jgi:D-alanyl-D-alanine dipeptidase
MIGFRRLLLALLLISSCAGCAHDQAADDPASSSQSSNPSSRTSSTARIAASKSLTRSAVSSSAPSTARRTPTVSAQPRPVLSSSAPRAIRRIPTVSAQARAAGLIEIRSIVPDAIVDLRYATSNNFVGVRLYPTDARCLVHESMAPGLTAAANQLKRDGDVLVFWDCYRPHPAQVHMFQIVSDPNWVARPGPYATSHEAGRSVDVTLAHAATDVGCPATQRVQGHCLLDMGTKFDDFSARAHAFATNGVSAQAQSNRARLRRAMNFGGIVVYSGEWWHFDGPGAGVQRPHLNAPLD